ncbi:hypothetical protein BGX28_007533 [Mortierella sp. GBA30]|nr:hypothetical protein BGX28_007533 [Mortierella sp. GBA30]
MIPYYPAVYIGPNGEQFPVGYHPPPMALPYEQHPHPLPHQQHQQHPAQHHPHHQQQHSLLQHQQHQQHQPRGPFPIHGPTSAPLPFIGSTTKPLGKSTLESISTPDMHQLETSASLESIGSGTTTGSSGMKGGSEGGDTNSQEEADEGQRRLSRSPSSPSSLPPQNQMLAQSQPPSLVKSSTTVFASRDRKATAPAPAASQPTSHHPNQRAYQFDKQPSDIPIAADPATPAAVDADTHDSEDILTGELRATTAAAAGSAAGIGAGTEASAVEASACPASIPPTLPHTTVPRTTSMPNVAANINTAVRPLSALDLPPETSAASLEKDVRETVDEVRGHKGDQQEQGEHQTLQQEDPTSSSPPQPKQQPQKSPSSLHTQHYATPPLPPTYNSTRQDSPPMGGYPPPTYQQPYSQSTQRTAATSSYGPSRQNHGPSKSFSGQLGQGPGPHGPMPLPPGPAPNHQGFGIPPPFFSPSGPSPASRRPMAYPGQGPIPSGSHSMAIPGVRPGQQYAGFKPPYMNQGFHQDYPQPGYYQSPETWRAGPPPTLQKKPKELDKAMWVGNVLNDTTVAELQAIFEAEPTEAEGDVHHDIPESIFILSKSNCAFVNYSSHEAVDRAVRRFHDREFKNTRLVCRPRKDPASDPYTSKGTPSNRFQPQLLHYGQPPYMSEAMGYFNHDHPLLAQRMDRYELSEAQTRIERMRLEASSPPGSSSSGGEGSASMDPIKKDKGGSKKSRSTSSLGYVESRYFILKGLNEEDLKLSVQYGLWATQDHLVPMLNEAFSNSKNVYLVFSANKSGEFFGYARMLDLISVENEITLTTGKEDEIWQPAADIPLSPEMKAAMLEEIDQAAKEGRQITNEEAEVIARASTTTKSWGVRFPIQWLHVHKVPFTRTAHLLNPLYENREVKVSKDGTEVDPVVGEQLINLFKKSGHDQRERSTVGGSGSRSNSEHGGSRRSSVTGDSSAPTSQQIQSRSTSTRRSSVMSTKSTESGGGERRLSLDPSRSHGAYKGSHSPHHATHRSQFSGDGGHQPPPGPGNYRSSARQQYAGPHGSNTPQGPYPAEHQPPYQDHQRQGWGSKLGYRGNAGGYNGGLPMQGGYYGQDHRKGGPGGGGKFGSNYYPSQSPAGGAYEQFASHVPRRHPGSQPQQYPGGGYRSNVSPPGSDTPVAGSVPFKHTGTATSPAMGQHPTHDHSFAMGSRGGPPPPPPPPGRHGPSNQAGQTLPPHPGAYVAQGPPTGYHAPFPPPGYPMMPPYMGYPYIPGPNPYMHGAMAWHPGQGPPMPANMMPGPGMMPPGHATSMPVMPVASADGSGIEGMVPLIGYDGVTYGYIPAEEAYSQHMYGYGYMPHEHFDPADQQVPVNENEEPSTNDEQEKKGVSGEERGDQKPTGNEADKVSSSITNNPEGGSVVVSGHASPLRSASASSTLEKTGCVDEINNAPSIDDH